MEQLLALAVDLSPGIQRALVTLGWVLAIGFGFYKYATSKGRIGQAIVAALGGGILIMFIINPAILTETVPGIMSDIFDWVAGLFEG